jgi:transposase-like protein
MSKKHKIAPEIKADILRRIKEEGVSVTQVAKDHGVSKASIYTWLDATAVGAPTWSEFAKLQKQNKDLILMVGELTMYLSGAQKRACTESRRSE